MQRLSFPAGAVFAVLSLGLLGCGASTTPDQADPSAASGAQQDQHTSHIDGHSEHTGHGDDGHSDHAAHGQPSEHHPSPMEQMKAELANCPQKTRLQPKSSTFARSAARC